MLGRNDHALAGLLERFNDTFVRVAGVVSDDLFAREFWQEMISSHQIMCLASSQVKAGWFAQRIDGGVDLCAQPAAGSSDCVIGAGFFGAPALCCWVGIAGQNGEDTRQDPGLGPAGKTRVDLDRVAEPFRQITPEGASPVSVEHCFDEEPVVSRGDIDMPDAAWSQVLDPDPLIVSKPIVSSSIPRGF